MTGYGDLYTAFLLGRVSEFCHCGDLFGHLTDICSNSHIIADYEHAVQGIDTWETKKFSSIWEFRSFRIVLYTLVRDLRPELVIETGVLHGMTSGFILEALECNRSGKLLSIDFPSYDATGVVNDDGYVATLPKGQDPGWLIPSRLQARWDLRIGRSTEVLKTLSNECTEIDLFCHDSEHTYSTMWTELSFAWERLNNKGVLICDNIEANIAFFDFCRHVKQVPLVLPTPSSDVSYSPRFALLLR